MKNIQVVFFLLFLLIFNVNAQNVAKSKIYLKSGYFMPFKESFRVNYNQSLFVSNVDFPMSLGIG
ncbi:MAG: hypothetical protein KAR38_16825, partial [Calditrichia bacterium]|nr:hypothetical protein [Calditrichia bacterium]